MFKWREERKQAAHFVIQMLLLSVPCMLCPSLLLINSKSDKRDLDPLILKRSRYDFVYTLIVILHREVNI